MCICDASIVGYAQAGASKGFKRRKNPPTQNLRDGLQRAIMALAWMEAASPG